MRKFEVSPEEHAKRNLFQQNATREFLTSVTDNKDSLDQMNLNRVMVNGIPPINTVDSDPRYATYPFGPANTIKGAGAMLFVVQELLAYSEFYIDVFLLAKLCTQNGYRSWYFENFPKKNFFTADFDAEVVKQSFEDMDAIKECTTREDFEKVLGKIKGRGVSFFFMDNLIVDYFKEVMVPVRDTRITSVKKIFENLENGFPVPARVQNSVFYENPELKEGHYIMITGYEGNNFIIQDSNYGELRKSYKTVINAITANEKLVAVWDVSHS